MKTLLVIFLVAVCSAAKLSPNQRASPDAALSGGGDFVTVTASNEHLSDEELETSTNQRFGKKLNSSSSEQNAQSYTTHYPYRQSYTTPFTKQYFSPVTESSNDIINGQSNQQYLPPIEEKNSFNVIPQESKKLNQQYLPPINDDNNSQFNSQKNLQSPSTQYQPSSPYQNNPSTHYYANQYEPQYSQSYNNQQNIETTQQPNPYYNPQLSQQTFNSFENQAFPQYASQSQSSHNSENQFSPQYTPQQSSQISENQFSPQYTPQQSSYNSENQFSPQYTSQKSTHNSENQYGDSSNLIQDQYSEKSYRQFNPIDLHESSQTTHSDNNRTPKEHIPSSRSDIYSAEENYNALPSSLATRRYDASTTSPAMQYNNNYQYNTGPTPLSYNSNYENRENYTNYNQYQERNNYQTTPPTVVEIGQSTNLPKWLSYSPSFMSRHDNFGSTINPPVQQAQSRQATVYGEKIHPQPIQQPHQSFFAAARSSNVGSSFPSTTTSTQAPEKYIEPQPIDRPRYIPQIPSQFKPAQPIRNDLISNPYVQQQSYAKTYQYPTSYQPGPTSYQPGLTTEPMPILKQMNEMDLNGNFIYETLTGDQTHIMQEGHVENRGTDHEEQVMQGSYSFIGDDGKTYTVTYIADANGFRATGDHLPTAPPIPEVIQRSIELNLAEEAAEAAQAAQNPQRYQYPQQDGNNRYPVVEQARERSSIPHIPNFDNGYKY